MNLSKSIYKRLKNATKLLEIAHFLYFIASSLMNFPRIAKSFLSLFMILPSPNLDPWSIQLDYNMGLGQNSIWLSVRPIWLNRYDTDTDMLLMFQPIPIQISIFFQTDTDTDIDNRYRFGRYVKTWKNPLFIR